MTRKKKEQVESPILLESVTETSNVAANEDQRRLRMFRREAETSTVIAEVAASALRENADASAVGFANNDEGSLVDVRDIIDVVASSAAGAGTTAKPTPLLGSGVVPTEMRAGSVPSVPTTSGSPSVRTTCYCSGD
jgi:hypothetical protein